MLVVIDAPRIDGYEIVRELGRGAMGVVYLARDRFLERDVAIKLVAETELTVDAVERFLREARAMARLSHPNVVTIYRAGVADGAPFLVMELLRGRSLDVILEAEGPLPASKLLTIAIESCRGIAAAHARGIVHRDIKPSNLFETDEGAIKVLDFGIAKLATIEVSSQAERGVEPARITAESLLPPWRASAPSSIAPSSIGTLSQHEAVRGAMAFEATVQSSPSITPAADEGAQIELADTRSSGRSRDSAAGTQVSGTALFMAPEVWRSEGADHVSDVWSLGATLYLLATGRPPFDGRNVAEIAFNVLVATPVAPLADKRADLPGELVEVIERCLAKNRARRFASAQEVLTALERIARVERAARERKTDAPYPGLRAMDAQDRDRFFGRDDDVARVIERLRGESLVVLVGASGTGKSSLAAAGVAPEVAEGALGELRPWRVVRVRPGPSPLHAMSSALASTVGVPAELLAQELASQPDALTRSLREAVIRDGQGVLLLIDQLEELVTTSAGDERDAIAVALARLVEVAPRGVRVLATARSDLFDRLGALGALGAKLGRATELLRPLEGAALREAIVEPARAAGASFEDESMLDRIVDEVGASAGSLPLVAFAMRAWWERRDRARMLLTSEAWESLGGVLGALGSHADAVYESLTGEERDAARAVFSRLVANDGTRRYATRAELEASASGRRVEVQRVLDAFSRARLVVCEGDERTGNWTIAHESLSRAWSRLRQWIDEGREDRALHQQLTEASRAWELAGRRNELLWRGALLQEIVRWREVYDDTLSPIERSFVERSLQRERRALRTGAVSLASIVVALGGAALWQRRAATAAMSAHEQAQHALRRLDARARTEVVSRSLQAAFEATERDPSSALAWLASAALSAGYASPMTRVAALAAVERGVAMRVRCTSNVALREDGTATACAVDDTVLWMSLLDGTVRRVDAPQTPRSVSIAERAAVIFWVDRAGQLMRWDEHTGPRRLTSELSRGTHVQSDPFGARAVLVDTTTDRLLVWEDSTGAPRDAGAFASPSGDVSLRVVTEGLMPDKQAGAWALHVPSRDAAVLAVRREGRVRVRRIPLDRGISTTAEAFECDSYLVRSDALLCRDGVRQRAWSIVTGTERPPTADESTELERSRANPSVLARSPDQHEVVLDDHGRASLRGRFAFAGPLGVEGVEVVAAAIEPSSHRVVVVDRASTLHVYGLLGASTSQARWLREEDASAIDRARSTQSARVVVASLPEARVAVGAVGLGAWIIDARDGQTIFSHREPHTVAVAAEGSHILLGLGDGSGVLIDGRSLRVARGALLEGASPIAVAVSADGERVAAVGGRGDAVWRRVSRGEWQRVAYRAFSELWGASALSVRRDRLAVAGRWLGLVQEGGLTTLASANASFFGERVARMRFSEDEQAVLTDESGSAWIATCREQRCRVEWFGEGDDIAPLGYDAAITVGARGAVRLLARGYTGRLTVFAPGRIEPLATLASGQGAVDFDDDAIVLAGPAVNPTVLRIALPPEDPQAFARWIALRTNMTVAPGGGLQFGAVPAALP